MRGCSLRSLRGKYAAPQNRQMAAAPRAAEDGGVQNLSRERKRAFSRARSAHSHAGIARILTAAEPPPHASE